jgi:WXXGXW repeat (2 copies)
MQHVDLMIGLAMAALGFTALSGCVTSPASSIATVVAPGDRPGAAPIVASHPPPPTRAEIPPPPPAPQALWRVGHWSWNGVKYVWLKGDYVLRPSPTANYVPGYWEQRPEGWIWIEGQWTS